MVEEVVSFGSNWKSINISISKKDMYLKVCIAGLLSEHVIVQVKINCASIEISCNGAYASKSVKKVVWTLEKTTRK
jgi:hypothetical protein